MRVIFTLIAVIVVLGWFGVELRAKQKDISTVLLGLAGLLFILLIGAFYELY